jgi:hypothetical protein
MRLPWLKNSLEELIIFNLTPDPSPVDKGVLLGQILPSPRERGWG